jgi:hypothetical protein
VLDANRAELTDTVTENHVGRKSGRCGGNFSLDFE